MQFRIGGQYESTMYLARLLLKGSDVINRIENLNCVNWKCKNGLELDHELGMTQSNGNFDSSNVPTPFRVDSAAMLLPKLIVEHEIETHFVMLEKITRTNE